MQKTNSVIEFRYNDDGIRTSKTVNGTEYVYTLNGSRIVSETRGDILLIYLYDESGSPIGMQYRKSSYAANVFDTFYFEKNLQGDIIAIYTESGRKILEYTYDAWGNHSVTWTYLTMETMQAGVNPFRYRGYYYDTDTGLYYLQSRYYNPTTGRFINADGYVNANGDLIGFNMYAYCSNNPVMNVDPNGQFVVSIFVACIIGGALIGGILGGTTAYKNNQDIVAGIAAGALLGGVAGAIAGVAAAGGGTAMLAGALSSTASKATTDLIGSALYGAQMGTWEDYAIAFVCGGMTAGCGFTSKTLIDSFVRPGISQLTKNITRGAPIDMEKYAYDAVTRLASSGRSNYVIAGEAFGLALSVDIGKCFVRSSWRNIYDRVENE